MDVVDQLKNALRCPVCLKKPQPKAHVEIGMCTNGHMICESCAKRHLAINDEKLCPMCREQDFRIVRGHSLAVSVLEILTAVLVYSCKNSNCNESRVGNEILLHETQCIHKQLRCPSATCDFKGPIQSFWDGSHPCVQLHNSLCDDAWNLVLDIAEIYSFEQNILHISAQYHTVMLRGTTSTGYESRAYINVKIRNSGLFVYCGWLDRQNECEEKYANLKANVFAYINTESGEIGHYSSCSPIYESEIGQQNEDGIHIPRYMVYNWAKWSREYRCHECNKHYPHMHIRVTFTA